MNIWLIKANEPMPIIGTEQRMFRMGMLAEKLQKNNHNITWFSSTFDHFQKKQIFENDKTIDVKPNYKIKLIWAPGYKKNISINRIINHKITALKFKKIASKMERPDIIYTAFPTINFAEEAINFGRKNNIPVIVDIRDLWPDTFNQNLTKLKRIIAFPYIALMEYKTKKIMKYANAITGISPQVVDWGLKKGNRKKTKNDKYFYIGYENTKTEINNNIIDINKNTFNLCFFGTLNKQFRFDKIINLAKILKDDNVNIYICGLGENYDYIQKEKLSNIKLLGWLNKEQLQCVLNNCQIGLAPYKSTFDFQMGISNKFAEYLSNGLPIVLTSGGYMGKIIDENECGINCTDELEIAKYIRRLKLDDSLYKQISSNAINLYNKEFVADKIYSELVKYLEDIYKEESNKK